MVNEQRSKSRAAVANPNKKSIFLILNYLTNIVTIHNTTIKNIVFLFKVANAFTCAVNSVAAYENSANL